MTRNGIDGARRRERPDAFVNAAKSRRGRRGDTRLLQRRRPNAIACGIDSSHSPETAGMTQTSNRFFDEVARLMNDAAGVAAGRAARVRHLCCSQAERILADLDVVRRDEFEAVKEMARLAREENEALKARIAALEAKLGRTPVRLTALLRFAARRRQASAVMRACPGHPRLAASVRLPATRRA